MGYMIRTIVLGISLVNILARMVLLQRLATKYLGSAQRAPIRRALGETSTILAKF